ncbi:glycosyltransferase [Lentimicrobium sp.]|uniref:glycosyltransferase n=1 Tax=Lentimicrobium sp. TaxID=2034841 RepID=UPI002D04A415|nr:glycosyltransferase [Lentimicrobium sp.]HPJ63641.1 glycosyltransferase [Lentimicrobium sp.]
MVSQKLKILFIIPSLEEGGAERVLVNLLKRFDYSRFRVDLFVVEKRGIYFDELPSQVEVFTLFNNEFLCKIFNGLHVRFNFNFVYRWLTCRKIRGHYDAGISFLDSGYTDILFFLKSRITRKVSWVHSSYQTYRNFEKFYTGAYKKRVIKHRYSKLDTIVFVSNDSKMEFEGIFGHFPSMKVIYNMIDASGVRYKAEAPVSESFDSNVTNIIALGVLLPVKGYDKLIRAARLLKDDGIRFRIRILGNGDLENELRTLVKDLDLENEVILSGFINNPFPYLKLSDIFVMTSVSEGLPTALCEAMILGLPAVVTDCSGCRELVGSGQYGMMVKQSAVSIYRGLKEMIAMPEKQAYFRKKSLERAEVFDDDAILEQVYELLEFKQAT